jgi:hypothetical protein
VHFCPATSPATKERVYVERGRGVVFSAHEREGMYYLEGQACVASATAIPGDVALAVHWHRRLGHLGDETLSKLSRAGMLEGCALTPASGCRRRHGSLCSNCGHPRPAQPRTAAADSD